MPYVLTLFVLAPHGEIRVSEKFFNRIKEANEGLPKIVAVEEKFDTLMENFVEIESTLLSLAAHHLAFEDAKVTDLIARRNLVSRRIANFLSSARLYRDSLPQHVLDIFGRNDPSAATFVANLKDAKSQPISYRMVEAFRNYVQHRALPLSNLIFRSSREGAIEQKASAFSFWLEPIIDVVAISKGRDVSKDVAAHLVKLGTNVNPMPLLREYVEYVGSIHNQFHQLIKQREGDWESSHSTARERYKKRFPKTKTIALGIGFREPDGTISNPLYISDHWHDYRQYLRVKNLTTTNYSKRYVKWSR